MVNGVKAGFFEYLNNFWEEARREPFSISEIALFHYLFNEANHHHWEMPIKCNTAIMSYTMRTTKQNIMKAREGLRTRGILIYEKGSGTNSPPQYRLLTRQEKYTGQLSGQLSVYNKKDIEQINNKKGTYDRRRRTEVQASQPSDYEGAF